ncbi:MAG: peptidylprolyl isomerase [Planctomycetota bacterium]|nr:peptidylprolyl isomerase [Planctomycetota bacterium]
MSLLRRVGKAIGVRNRLGTNRLTPLAPAAPRRGLPVVEPLEPRLLLAGDLPSITRIEADNRGLVVLTASERLDSSTLNERSITFTTAGNDGAFGTADDRNLNTAIEYIEDDGFTIRISADVSADQRYRIRLDSSIIRGRDGGRFDGEFNGADQISGDGQAGGDLIFFTRRPAQEVARFTTLSGIIDVELFRDRTPLTVQNFLNYANRGAWDGTMFHRSVPGFVIQAGGFRAEPPFARIPQDAAVQNEPGISNLRGTIAMAKLGGNPNSATNEWFFNLGNNSSNLDNQNGGFTVFGEITSASGLEVMDDLAAFLTVNASNVQGAFNEIPVRDRDAVNQRNPITLTAEDVIRIDRIALLVDVDGTVPDQLDPTGSVTFTGRNGENGPRVQVYDLDQLGIGAADFVRVTFSGDRVTEIRFREGMPEGRVGIVISNARSVDAIVDSRRSPDGDIAFIISSAPVVSIRLESGLSGFQLGGNTVPGLALGADIDGDGDESDPLALYVDRGLVSTLSLEGPVAGDLVLRGGVAGLSITGLLTGDLVIGQAAQDRSATIDLGNVRDAQIRSQMRIASLDARSWTDVSDRQEVIGAPSIGMLRIDGNFQAGLDIAGQAGVSRALFSARIDGNVTGSTWIVRGAMGDVTLEDATGWTVSNATAMGSLTAGHLTSTSITVAGPATRVIADQWSGGVLNVRTITSIQIKGDRARSLPGDFTATLTVNAGQGQAAIRTFDATGAIRNSTINVTGLAPVWRPDDGVFSSTINLGGGDVRIFQTDDISATTLDIQATLARFSAGNVVTSNIRGGGISDFRANSFSGTLSPGFLTRARIADDLSGTLETTRMTSLQVGGNATSATIVITQAAPRGQSTLSTLDVRGSFDNSVFRANGRVDRITLGAMRDSQIYVGAPGNLSGFPASSANFDPGSRLARLSVAGSDAVVENSFVVATNIDSIRLDNVVTDNDGATFGVDARRIARLTAETDLRTVRVSSPDANLPALNDFQIRVGLAGPAVTPGNASGPPDGSDGSDGSDGGGTPPIEDGEA